MFKCLKCNKIYNTQSGLWKHVKYKHTKPKCCQYCKKDYKYNSRLETHLKTCKKKKIIKNSDPKHEISNVINNIKRYDNDILNKEHIEILENCLNNIINKNINQSIQQNIDINISDDNININIKLNNDNKNLSINQ